MVGEGGLVQLEGECQGSARGAISPTGKKVR